MANPKAFPVNECKNRLKGGLPKIGIRPCIDGRCRGVRESLEEQTMNIAKSVKEFLEANLRHTCGLPVECVIADSTIGRVAESAACQEKFDREGVGLTISVTPCWCYGAETMDMDPLRPKAIYGFNGTERPGAVYLASVLAAHAQKGLPAFGIYGRDVREATDMELPEDVREKLLRFAKAGLAVATMRGKSYLSMGSTAMGIAGSMVDPAFLEKYLGMRSESVDMVEFTRRWEEGIYDKEMYEKALAWARENVNIGYDKNPAEQQHDAARKEWVLETCVKMGIIAEDLMQGNPKLAELGFPEEALGHNAIAAGFQGQRQWTDHFPNGDYMESLLNSSFDWNGIREPFVVATENDHLNGIAMLFGKLLTNQAQGFADVRTYWSPEALKAVTGWTPTGLAENGFIHLINSGAAMLDATGAIKNDKGESCVKPWWELKGEDAAACMDATQYCYADLGYFRGGGYSSQFRTNGVMPMTMVRVNIVDGLGPVLQLAEGWTVDLPDDVFEIINKRTDPTWPSTFFVPRLDSTPAFKDVYSVMNNWGANHGSFCYGHIGADLITLCSMLRIPVCMHNVSSDKIFRPSAWNAFGMDQEGADYRACANFGPLYGRK
ncbi:MAG TPA: L-fucose isomerase [Candidatus Fimadaptatus faecigallinarum]|uniref:L-fucose isomerase n=1 Tax=Candidatus Fimadaptatus faecigallinarum TaxID=2840814 RepID=A0A9D1LSP3_9FIRM|nr:L-fucose isomerase [Candidatus Fimadaptatus faecigallinarum]